LLARFRRRQDAAGGGRPALKQREDVHRLPSRRLESLACQASNLS
jgi:hypothetical protein